MNIYLDIGKLINEQNSYSKVKSFNFLINKRFFQNTFNLSKKKKK